MTFSPDGKYFAWISGTVVKISECNTWQIIATIQCPKVQAIQFSSLGTYLMTWEPFIVSKANPDGSPQLHIWKTENGELVKSFTQKRQADWEPQWSYDEKICGILINGEIFFYENANFDKHTYKVSVTKQGRFNMSPGKSPYYIVFYFPGKTGQPSSAKIFEYGKFEVSQSLTNKSFFQSDRLEFYWNNEGTSLLMLTSMDVDKTGASYYGKQSLHYLNIKGETNVVTLSNDESPIHAVKWSPKNTEFCVTYGFMPTKTTLFNLKCESIFEFGKKHRNSIYYNCHGNILLLGGFGNLGGDIELWDMTKRKLIAETKAPDSTLLHWSPDGEHFMTATTAPRLRMSNGFKIWHYTGTLLYERPWSKQEELWQVVWKNYPINTYPQKTINYTAVEGITPSQPQASKEAYRPPSARGKTNNSGLHDDNKFPPPTKMPPSKATLKTKKKREAKKKAKKELESNDLPNIDENGVEIDNSTDKPKKIIDKKQGAKKNNTKDSDLTDDPEKNKKIRKIKSKLEQITKLKEQQTAGKRLEINQLDKVQKEDELVKELQALIMC